MPKTIWDAEPDCQHQWGDTIAVNATNHTDKRRWNHTRNCRDEEQPIEKRVAWLRTVVDQGNFCQACGAWRGALGLEPTPELFVQHIVQVFREVWRTLRNDGTLWLNLGDSYATGAGKVGECPGGGEQGERWKGNRGAYTADNSGKHSLAAMGPRIQPNRMPIPGLKPKDLIGVPWRVAFALQNDGWYLRSDIIWAKPSPMPESVTDRPTRSHEYIFLLAKNEKYYCDMESIKEPAVCDRRSGNGYKRDARLSYSDADGARGSDEQWEPASWKGSSFTGERDVLLHPNVGRKRRSPKVHGNLPGRDDTGASCNKPGQEMRNLRDVWTINTEPYAEAHFACVDEQTECLTTNGWRTHDKIRIGDTAAQLDMESGFLSWAPISNIAHYPVVDEPLISAVSRDLNLLLTPNHRTIISRRSQHDRRWKAPSIVRADAVKTSHGLPVSAPWERTAGTSPSQEWAELLGWYVAEGYQHSTGETIEIYQSSSANSTKVGRIRFLLDSVKARYSEATAPRVWRGRSADLTAFQVDGFAAVKLRQLAPGKELDWSCLDWSDQALASLWRGMVDGDGHVRRDDDRESFVQKSIRNCDVAQAIGVLLGFATKLGLKAEGGHALYFTRKRYISLRGTKGEGAKIGYEKYTGIVWCPQLPKGTWVARRNGRMFITGNTFPPKLIEPCVIAGAPVGGVILDPFCGAGTTGLVAKKHGRSFIGIELNPEYIKLAEKRCAQDVLEFTDSAALSDPPTPPVQE